MIEKLKIKVIYNDFINSVALTDEQIKILLGISNDQQVNNISNSNNKGNVSAVNKGFYQYAKNNNKKLMLLKSNAGSDTGSLGDLETLLKDPTGGTVNNPSSAFSLSAAGAVNVTNDNTKVESSVSNSTITAKKSVTIDADRENKMLNISGGGSLTVTSVNWYPISTDASCSIVIDNTTVDLHSTGYGDYGINNNSQELGDVEIIKSTVRAGSINRVHSVTLTDCRIASPADAEVTETGISKVNVFIVPVYPTGINEVQDSKEQGMKVLRDGAVYILRDGKEYNVKGERMR